MSQENGSDLACHDMSVMSLQQKVGRVGLAAGPLLGLLLYFSLPADYLVAFEPLSGGT
jgi:hypothetical protein